MTEIPVPAPPSGRGGGRPSSLSGLCLPTAVFLAAVLPAAGAEWTLESAMKQVDKALSGVEGITAEAEVLQVTPQGETNSAAETSLTVLYKNIARNDNLNKDLFEANWPKGTEKDKK